MALPRTELSMKRALAVLGIFLLTMLSAAPAARPDALTSGRNAPEARGPVLPFGGALTARLASAQRTLNDSIAAAFRDVRDRQSRTAIVLILGLAFLYGVLHAVGPGSTRSPCGTDDRVRL